MDHRSTRQQGLIEPNEQLEPLSIPAGGGSCAPGSEQAALEQLAVTLRVWGQYAFDLDEIDASAIREQIEHWVLNLLVARAPAETLSSSRNAEPGSANPCDWAGLSEFVTLMRRREQNYVNRQILGTRQVMGDFVQTLGQILAEDQEEQTRVTSIIGKLRCAIESNAPVETLSQEAIHAIDLITHITQEREQRHQIMLHHLTARLQTLRGELDAAQREMELDSMTRLYNRKAFDTQLDRVFELSKLSGQPACLMMVDADFFKTINDRFGHPVGDLVLRRLANCCAEAFPRKTDFVARYGGEEFAVVLQDTSLKTAIQLGERLLDAVRAMTIEHESGVIRITISIGLAEIDPHASAGQWLRATDSALYRAKSNGRDQLACLTAS
ncbi:GGDEF domain-containing protein [Thiocystis violascens]|uniref:diguanylate cyclase n=1 Tax=Thiocystis violascens (strain ATCC 17096 / DSM 198 / 6111) TaxID=765911 RepID=I3Y6Y8_THIV6|nr:GGDEF domain-containing protein [Thiocystis violascens]AFL72756.1 diguanylate cyclase (GGDEF) domain-containing protein [Thiocystis violascens DSM 198]